MGGVVQKIKGIANTAWIVLDSFDYLTDEVRVQEFYDVVKEFVKGKDEFGIFITISSKGAQDVEKHPDFKACFKQMYEIKLDLEGIAQVEFAKKGFHEFVKFG